MRLSSLSPLALARAITRFVLTLTLAVALFQRVAVALPPPDQQLALDLPPESCCQPFTRTISEDLSAGVRVHRENGASLDVWLVTPVSRHWNDAIATAPPLAEQLSASGWLSGQKSQGRARFERITVPPPLGSLRPKARPWLRVA